MVISGILYGLWLLLPVLVFFALKFGRASRSTRIRSTLAVAVLTIPAYLGLVCLFTGAAWPPDIFFPNSGSRIGVSIPNYRVEYAQQWGTDFYVTYYQVTRQDGQEAFLQIDGDDSKCWTLTTRQVGSKIYFLCDERTISEGTSYLDTEQGLLYAGWTRCTRYLDALPFRDYAGNPLLDASAGRSNELFCP
jgi:hypothetical protein